MIGSFKTLDEKRQKLDNGRPTVKFAHPFFDSVWLHLSASVLSGVMLALGFPGFGNTTIVFAALVPLMFAVQSATIKKACWLSLLSGFVFFMVSLFWLHNLTGTVEGIPLKISALAGYALLALYCAIYFIPLGITVVLGAGQWLGDNVLKNVRFMFAVTMVWVASEYLRGILFTGFPWNPLGITQYANPAIIQIAEWGGVSMVTAYIIWMNAGIYITFRQYTHGTRMKKYRPHYELMIGILPVALSIAHGIQVLSSRPGSFEHVNVALVQPNIPQEEKWDPQQDQMIRDRLEQLTQKAMRLHGIDLIIWPETAVPDFMRTSRASYGLVRRITEGGIPLLVGTMDVKHTEDGRTYYNSSMLFGQGGVEIAKYDKQHLVPFGEYVPFPKLMRKFTPIDVDFEHGAGSTILPLENNPSFSVLICFEDTVAPLAAKATQAGARWLVNQTNDAWFDPSSQSEQHLAHAVFRCIENRIPMARCCNTGITCVIDAYGNVDRELLPRTEGFTTRVISPRAVDAGKTFYTRHPDAFSRIAVLCGTAVMFVLGFNHWKRRKKDETDQV